MSEPQTPQTPPEPPTYRLRTVVASLAVFYAVTTMLGSHGLYNWSQKLPVSEIARTIGKLAEAHWSRMAALGLEEPEFALESAFLRFQEAHPLLYPRKYADVMRRKEDKTRRLKQRDIAEALDPKLKTARLAAKELLEPDERVPPKADPKVLVLGDSIMMTVGPVIKHDVTSRLGGAAVVKAKLATGLARPDVFDWVKELKRLTARRRFDYIVMMFGTNDSQNFVENGEIMTYGTEPWVKAYDKRLQALMDEACGGGKHGVWVGLPPMQTDAFNRKALRINSLAQRQVARHACMEYVSIDRVVGDENGNFVGYRKVEDRVEKIRMVDGIHITARGGSLVSSALMDVMQGALAH